MYIKHIISDILINKQRCYQVRLSGTAKNYYMQPQNKTYPAMKRVSTAPCNTADW